MSASLISHFQMLGRYNAIVNERLYEVCADLSEQQYRKEGPGSFGSIHRTLNHLLLGDQIWMNRFTSPEVTSTPPLGTILHQNFPILREARVIEDARIGAFLAGLTDSFVRTPVCYCNSAGKYFEDPLTLVLQHMFNHATHHRGQVHVMLSQFGKTVNLDMHRAINPIELARAADQR